MDEQNKNLILATVLSLLVILVWFWLFPPEDTTLVSETPGTSETLLPPQGDTAPIPPATPGQTGGGAATPETVADLPRIEVETPRLAGAISLLGGRIDTLTLNDYRVENEPDSPNVTLLAPVGGNNAYYALYGWTPGGDLSFDDVPDANTEWSIESGTRLTPENPITLVWENSRGGIFRRTISIDENYLFTVTQSVENTGTSPIRLAPYGIVARHGEPETINFFIVHEGVVRQNDDELEEINYSDMPDMDFVEREGARVETYDVTENGWVGFTDHYWMTTLIPAPGQAFQSVVKYVASADIYQVESRLPTQTVEPGARVSVETHLFAGAKEWETIREYENGLGIKNFVDSIDWGWFFFLTKPIFAALHWLNALIGNMGWAILALTLVIKAVLFPLAYRSYVSMAKMKELQPEMEKIKERSGDDRQKLQKEMMELYKTEKVNPASGCLPILLQIPIFFSLYKVIFVTIELRHAPWLGPFQDLSAPDPTSIANLFGLLPWSGPEPGSLLALLLIGILPLLLGISMWLQQKLNPAPTDPTQKMIFAWMPWVFMFMLGSFASGLVLYWIANNTITFVQQYLIMRANGTRPDVFGNIRESFKKTAARTSGATTANPKPANGKPKKK
ncbi:MAG: membrane protein insertase YidC [Pseudomonadota bacterium]